MRHPDYPFWSFTALILVALPAPWHWRARNIATLSIIFWLTLANAANFVNTIIWADNYRDSAPVWCDISSRIILLVNFAIPACSLSQMRRLESVASTRRSSVSARDRKRLLWQEFIICNAIPVLLATLSYVVQGHRYDIRETVGCSVPGFVSMPELIIRSITPIVLSVASLIFAVLAVRWFLVRRLQFRSILASSDSSLSVSRYLRLIALAATDSTVVLSLFIYEFAWLLSASSSPIQAYHSWSYVHKNFSQVAQYPEEWYEPGSYYAQAANTYGPTIYSILFFTFFGFGEEAIAEYLAVTKRILAWGKYVLNLQHHGGVSSADRNVQLGSKIVMATSDVSDSAVTTAEAKIADAVDDLVPTACGDENGTYQGRIAVRVERSIV